MKLLLGLVAFVFASLALPAAEFRPGDSVEVRWGDKWAPATVLERSGNAYKVNYEGGGRTGVEWVIPSKMRLAEAATATADDDDDPEGEEESDEDE